MSMNISQPSETQNQILSKTDLLRQAVRKGWTPPPRLSVPEWADRYRKLAKEAGSTSGQWSTATVEIARGPMLAVTEPGVHVITCMVSTQLMKTALLENVFGFFAHLDPCPILLVQPKEDAAEKFSKERISPLIRSTPVLRKLIGTSKTRNSDETLSVKMFPGGFLAMVGAGSPDNLARRPVRIILADEVDKYPVTREGDPIALAEERTATFGNWLSVRACSPTVEDESRIAASYQESDQRRASVECPHCQARIFLDFFKHVQWYKDGDKHLTKTAQIFCHCCGAAWSEGERLRALRTVRWHQAKPYDCCGHRHVPLDEYQKALDESPDTAIEQVWEWHESNRHAVYRAKCPDCGGLPIDNEHAGYQASKLFSPWPKDAPPYIAKKYIEAKGDPDKEQTWWNTQMGLPYRPQAGKALSPEALVARCEVFPAEVPDGVAVITVGGDVQQDRVEMEVVGWGANEESWSIDYEVFYGNPAEDELWNKVDSYLKRIWRRADGRGFEVTACCIDSGYHTQKVYEFSKARLSRRIWATKGESARMGQRSPVWPTKKPSNRNKSSFRPIILGVNAAKDMVRHRLNLEKPGPGYMHFPTDRDIGYFAQITSERLIVKVTGGQRYRVWDLPSGRANEALDCRVYAYAALCGITHYGFKLNRRADEIANNVASLLPPVASGPNVSTAEPKKRSIASMLAA